MRISALWLSFTLVAAACSQEIQPPDPRNLDRPSDMAFACFGDHLRVDPEDPLVGQIVREAQPVQNCVTGQEIEADAGTSPAPGLFGFVLQGESGTVALVDMTVPGQAGVVIDSDPLVPGKNSIPVGTLPVSIVTDPSGCHLLIANAGTCDLSIMDVEAAIEQEASVTRQSIATASGDALRAEPAMMVGDGTALPAGQGCPAGPTGLVYVAYPRCNLVAVVDTSGGQSEVVAGIRFAEDGSAEITDGDVSCPAECGGDPVPTALAVDAGPALDGGAPDAGPADAGPPGDPDAGPPPPLPNGAPQPVALELAPDGSALYVGASNAPMVAKVTLGADRMPVSVDSIPLEGDVGVTDLTATGPLEMGGALGTSSYGKRNFGLFDFVYAIATDRSIRVVEVDDLVECDTQVDPRFYHDSTAATEFQCFEVGSALTPPRRAGADGPGIRLPRNAVPLDVAVFDVHNFDEADEQRITSDTPRAPSTFVGHFALVTSSDGFAHVINIDDDHYPDFEDSAEPGAVDLPLAVAHQPRDGVERLVGQNLTGRNERPTTCSVSTNAEEAVDELNVRAEGGVLRLFDTDLMSTERSAQVPRGRTVECFIPGDNETPASRAAVSELNWGAPADVHELAFPDVAAARNEEFFLVWEGRLSLDDNNLAEDGPPVRIGIAMQDGGDLILVDSGSALCRLGAEPYDVVQLQGCQVDAHCSLGEECAFHPDSTVSTGLCLPEQLIDGLLGRCRDILISNKRFTITETYAGHVALAERRRVLRTTPLEGCIDDAQCMEHAKYEPFLASDTQPYQDDVDNPPEGFEQPYTFACVDDPSRAPGPKRCVMTCEDELDCEDGTLCSGGFCVEAPLPPIECMQSLQRYDVRAGDAFSVVGAALESSRVTGYVHNRIVDPDTGQCIDDPDGNPLLAGRIPLIGLPDCAGDGLADVTPNPCLTTIDHGIQELFEFQGGECVEVEPPEDDPDAPILETRVVPAIRFRNPVFTMHLVDISTPGDLNCHGDRLLGLAPFSPVYAGFQMTIRIAGGSIPYTAPISAARPATIVKGPVGFLWVLDEGDVTSGTVTNGRVIRLDPTQAGNGFGTDAPVTIL